MNEYSGGRGHEAATNDNALAEKEWPRIMPIICKYLLGGAEWKSEPWGSNKDKDHCVDGYICFGDVIAPVARRLQPLPFNTFTLRHAHEHEEFNREYEKLILGIDRTQYHLQAYLRDTWQGEFRAAGIIRTEDLRDFAMYNARLLDNRVNNYNGIPFKAARWDRIRESGYDIAILTQEQNQIAITGEWRLQKKRVRWVQLEFDF